jgi:integrase
MSIYQRGQTWHCDITVEGQSRLRQSLGTTNKTEAKRLHDELRAELHKRKADGHTWYDAIAEWLRIDVRSKKDKSALLLYDPGDIPVTQITADSFGISHHKAGTYRRYANLFKSILSVAKDKGWIDEVPKFQPRKIPAGRVRWLTRDEWSRLYAELPDHMKPIALFAVSTGLRQFNVLRMEWSRIDLQRKVAWVSASQMKNGLDHGLPLSDMALQALDMVAGQNKRWCFTYNGERMETIGEAWTRSLSRAGITNFRWHDLRHTWASWHIMSGTPVEVLQKLGGWKDLSMVMRYAHLAPDHLAQFSNNVTKYVTK